MRTGEQLSRNMSKAVGDEVAGSLNGSKATDIADVADADALGWFAERSDVSPMENDCLSAVTRTVKRDIIPRI